MKVFCVGLGKTGTSTFAECMTRLGFWHRTGPGPWGLLMRQSGRTEPLMRLAAEYDSVDDFPWPYLYRELAEHFPDARFVLTKRCDPDTWFDSLSAHYDRAGGSLEWRLAYGLDSPYGARDELIDLYERHNRAVARYFSGTGRLKELVWENGDGWAELCDFLDLPRPAGPLPHRNAARNKDPVRNLDRLVRQGKLEQAEYLCRLYRAERPELLDRFMDLIEPGDLNAPVKTRLRHRLKGRRWVKG